MRQIFRTTDKATGLGSKVLIPVDFSSNDELAIRIGFELADRIHSSVEILHATPIPTSGIIPQFPDDFNGVDNIESEIEEVELDEAVYKINDEEIRKTVREIKDLINNGELPDISFSDISAPGMPEEVIYDYCNERQPAAIVMVTRNLARKKEEMVGSVTAEVIDSCRVPIFSIPEHYHFEGFKKIERLCAFCFLEGEDRKCIETLMRMFGNPDVSIMLFPSSAKLSDKESEERMDELYNDLIIRFPEAHFHKVYTESQNKKETARQLFESDHIQMILAPNKKRNAFIRFFQPGLPHRILFENDIPILAIPV